MSRKRKIHEPLPNTFNEVLGFIANERKPKKQQKRKDGQKKSAVNK